MKTYRRCMVPLIACALIGGAGIGCASTENQTLSPADSGPEESADLFPADTTRVVATPPVLVYPTPAGSSCERSDTAYTLDLPARKLSWKVCKQEQDSELFAFDEGERTLSAEEVAPIETALHALRKADPSNDCVAGTGPMTVTFTTPAGDQTYYDDTDCSSEREHATGIEDVLSEFQKLAAQE